MLVMKRINTWLTIGLQLVVSACLLQSTHVQAQKQPEKKELRAGAATSNITPPLGTNIVGNFTPILALHVHDELHARCLVLDDGDTKIAMVICDLLGLHRQVSLHARKLIQEQTGIPFENVLIAGTHTHSASSALGQSRYRQDIELDDYQKFVARRIADGVQRAANLLRPAEIAFGTVEAPEHVFNRRWFMKEGTAPPNPFGKIDKVKMNPPRASENLVEPAGPTDPTLSFFALREKGDKSKMIALFAAYSLHYVGGVGPGHISADYFAHFCKTVEKSQQTSSSDDPDSPPFVAFMANGTSGDINNVNFRKPSEPRKAYEQIRFVAEDLAGKVQEAVKSLTWSGDKPIKVSAHYKELELDRKPITDELIAWAKETKAKENRIKGKGVDLSQIYADRVLMLEPLRHEKVRVPLQHLRIGDIGIGTFPTETFAETGLAFKKRSPVKHRFMVELAHGYLGYLPTPRHFELGGYETWPGTNHLEPEASEKMLEALLELASESVKGEQQ